MCCSPLTSRKNACSCSYRICQTFPSSLKMFFAPELGEQREDVFRRWPLILMPSPDKTISSPACQCERTSTSDAAEIVAVNGLFFTVVGVSAVFPTSWSSVKGTEPFICHLQVPVYRFHCVLLPQA